MHFPDPTDSRLGEPNGNEVAIMRYTCHKLFVLRIQQKKNRNIYLCSLSLSFLMLNSMDDTILVKCWHRIVQCLCLAISSNRRNEHQKQRQKEKKPLIIKRMRGLRLCLRKKNICTVIDSLRAEVKVNFHLHVTPKLSASMGTSFSQVLFAISFRFHATEICSIRHCFSFALVFFSPCFVWNLPSFLYGDSQFIVRTQFDNKNIYISKRTHSILLVYVCVCVIFLFSSFVNEQHKFDRKFMWSHVPAVSSLIR